MTIDRVLSLTSETATEPVVVQQNDRESRTLRLYPVEHGGNPCPTEGRQARILFRKNGATSPAYEATVQPDGWIVLTIPEAVTANPGSGEMQLVLEQGGSLLHSFTLPFTVKASLSFVGEVESPADDPMAVNWKNLPGKPAAFPPSAHTHTPAQAGALAAGGTAVNAAKLGGKAPQHYLRPRNLLDNSWFADPVNQLEKNAYTGAGYTIDRWRQSNAFTTMTIDSGCIRYSASGGIAYPRQYVLFQPAMYGKWYTAAVCTTDGRIVTASALIDAAAVSNEVTLATGVIADGVSLRLTKSSDDRICVRIDILDGKSAALCWAALYEGSFTADTLPPFVPEKPATTLAACRMHFRRTKTENGGTIGTGMAISATQAWILIPRSPMRISKPTVTTSGTLLLHSGNAPAAAIAVAVDKISGNCIRLLVTASGLTPGSAVVAAAGDSGFVIDENANL